ncbi:HAD family hydrolase [Thermococcus henrietii]|uniref:HAD family hydrolase n=1 Tax=Thermococcus henrietii TaxID=2016361 RepID=UPI000C084B65|nr:HAD family hydrolase [Thermococcus henrietii]
MLVLVDLDDTLCNTWEAGKRTILRAVPFLVRRGKFRALLYLLVAKYRGLEDSERLHTLDLHELVEELFGRIYPEITERELVELSTFVENHFFRHLRLYDDAVPFLEGIKELGARVVLITDSSTNWQRKKLEVLGIMDYFDDVIISGETGHSKFESHNFRLALERFPDKEVYVVGDRDETDMAGARAIGAVGILVRRGYFSGKRVRNADYIVRNLLEALEVIKREHQARAQA